MRSIKVAAATTALSTMLGTMLAFSIVRGRYLGKSAVNQIQVILVTIVLVVVSRFGAGAPSQTGNLTLSAPEARLGPPGGSFP